MKKDSPASLKPSVGLKKVVRAKYPGTRIAWFSGLSTVFRCVWASRRLFGWNEEHYFSGHVRICLSYVSQFFKSSRTSEDSDVRLQLQPGPSSSDRVRVRVKSSESHLWTYIYGFTSVNSIDEKISISATTQKGTLYPDLKEPNFQQEQDVNMDRHH